jgi:hypothetical protein
MLEFHDSFTNMYMMLVGVCQGRVFFL